MTLSIVILVLFAAASFALFAHEQAVYKQKKIDGPVYIKWERTRKIWRNILLAIFVAIGFSVSSVGLRESIPAIFAGMTMYWILFDGLFATRVQKRSFWSVGFTSRIDGIVKTEKRSRLIKLTVAAIALIVLLLPLFGRGNKIYVSTSGSETAAGTIDAPLKNLFFASPRLQPGDTLLLKGGQTHFGDIVLNQSVAISSYDTGRAVLQCTDGGGIYLQDADNISITNLIVKGVGYSVANMWCSGVEVTNYMASRQYKNIVIDNVDVSGFGYAGIAVSAWGEKGFDSVSVTNCDVHENGISGLWINGSWSQTLGLVRQVHNNVYVGNCKAWFNHGRPDYADNWSGSGILVAGTIGGVVEYCEAWENGKDNASKSAGPVGIWADDSKAVTIQYCISHHNRGGKYRKDGGGFDLDGGSQNCVIQHCDSYENEGAGFGLFQWQTNNKYFDDTIRNCTSINDGSNPGYGSFTFWGAGANYKVENVQIYGNRIEKDSGAAITFIGSNMSGIEIHDNSFCLSGSGVVAGAVVPAGVTIFSNSFPCQTLGLDTTTSTRTRPVVNTATYLKAFPNPATTFTNVEINVPRGKYILQVVGVNGVSVTSQPVIITNQKTIQLNVANYPRGMYVITVRNEYGIKAKTTLIK